MDLGVTLLVWSTNIGMNTNHFLVILVIEWLIICENRVGKMD